MRKGWLVRALCGDLPHWGRDPAVFDASRVSRMMRWVNPLFGPGCYFGLDVQGWENLPGAPVLLVSNHSGGTTIPDVWGLLMSWYRQVGVERPLHTLAHELILSTNATGEFFGRLGVLHASPDVALAALRDFGRDVLVMPGGDLDTWRPWRDRYQVRFGGRTGYARLALKAGVPIVPVANAGAHETLFVLTDGQKLARALGLQRLARARIFPVHLSLPWGLTVGPWPHLPLPAKLRYRIGAPIPVPRREEPTDDEVRALDLKVQAAVQGLLHELAQAAPKRRGRGSMRSAAPAHGL